MSALLHGKSRATCSALLCLGASDCGAGSHPARFFFVVAHRSLPAVASAVALAKADVRLCPSAFVRRRQCPSLPVRVFRTPPPLKFQISNLKLRLRPWPHPGSTQHGARFRTEAGTFVLQPKQMRALIPVCPANTFGIHGFDRLILPIPCIQPICYNDNNSIRYSLMHRSTFGSEPVMAVIKNIRSLKQAGVLADRTQRTENLDFKRFNLIYGFNGSGKSTLSRLFSTVQKGEPHERLPRGCTFEFEMDDGTSYRCPGGLEGLQNRLCVFNTDFIEENLQWGKGRANPVFHIGKEQAELAAKLEDLQTKLPQVDQKALGDNRLASSKDNEFARYKREAAKSVAKRLRIPGRKYEAPDLVSDYKNLPFNSSSILTSEQLDELVELSSRSAPLTRLNEIHLPRFSPDDLFAKTERLLSETAAEVILQDLDDHPSMVPWVKTGHDYHESQSLDKCLFCGQALTESRRRLIATFFDGKLSAFIESLNNCRLEAEAWLAQLRQAPSTIPDPGAISADIRLSFSSLRADLLNQIKSVESLLASMIELLEKKQATPTKALSNGLFEPEEAREACRILGDKCNQINEQIAKHNAHAQNFDGTQKQARENIRKHFLAEGHEKYLELAEETRTAHERARSSQTALNDLINEITGLKTKVREHGPAAEKINRLVESYLGHNELTISPAEDGYNLLRHGKIVQGAPSEGEKTAIALCYFLSSLESDGRQTKDLIIVVDDPISSLDTRALNFSCSLIKNTLSDAAQLFVLTHNMHFMNEFKKGWKGLAHPRNTSSAPTARLFFLDVKVPIDGTARLASLIELPKSLRDYDSEYHFLFQKVLQFEADANSNFPYIFMMPNVIRRVLDVFLAFRVPHTGPLKDKIRELCNHHSMLDRNRLTALERLTQVESHSDSLDDLITHSSMTFEELRDGNMALLYFMEKVDPEHIRRLRKYCKPRT